MARVEVEEEEFQRDQNLRKLVAEMLNKPESRRKLLEAQKLRYPDTPIPELDAAQPYVDALNNTRKEFYDYVQAEKEAKAKEEQERKLSELGSKYEQGRKQLKQEGYTDEGIKAIEDLMNKEGIVNHEIGRSYFDKLHPPSTPTNPSGTGSWGFFDNVGESGDDIKKLIESKGENEPLLRKMVGDALAEVRGGSRQR